MNKSSAKPLHDPSTFVSPIPAKGAASIIAKSLKVLSKDHENMRGASDVPMSRPCFTMKVNSPLCPCKKDHSVLQSLCHPEVSLEHLFACRFSLCAREGIAHVGERVQVRLPHRSQVPSHTSLCQHRSFSPSSSEESETVSLTTVAKRLFPKRAKDVCNSCAQHSFLSVTFFDQGARHGKSPMLTSQVGAHPEVFGTIRWWLLTLAQFEQKGLT